MFNFDNFKIPEFNLEDLHLAQNFLTILFFLVLFGLFFRILYAIYSIGKNSNKKGKDDPITKKVEKKLGIGHKKAHAVSELIKEQALDD